MARFELILALRQGVPGRFGQPVTNEWQVLQPQLFAFTWCACDQPVGGKRGRAKIENKVAVDEQRQGCCRQDAQGMHGTSLPSRVIRMQEGGRRKRD